MLLSRRVINIRGKIEIGQIQSFFQYIRNFTMPITQLSQVANMFQSTAAAAERVFEFLEAEEEQPTTTDPLSISGLEGNVEFKNVRFGYTPDKIIINDFSAKVSKGQRLQSLALPEQVKPLL